MTPRLPNVFPHRLSAPVGLPFAPLPAGTTDSRGGEIRQVGPYVFGGKFGIDRLCSFTASGRSRNRLVKIIFPAYIYSNVPPGDTGGHGGETGLPGGTQRAALS